MRRRDQGLGAGLFGTAGAVAWGVFAWSLGGMPLREIAIATAFGLVACGVVGAGAAPFLASEARGGASVLKGAALGMFVLLAGTVAGVMTILLVLSVLTPSFGIGVAAFVLAAAIPLMGLGAIAGAAFYGLCRPDT